MEWQPIETAPKDGATIFMALGKLVGSGRYRSRHGMAQERKDFYFDGATMPSGSKYWMPVDALPPPPAGA